MRKLTISIGQLVIFLAVLVPITCSAQTAEEKFWKEYVEACSPSALLNGHAKFLGATNVFGPGTTFGTNGGTANPIAQLTSYLPADKAESVIVFGNPANCSAIGSKSWDLTLGVPVSFPGSPDSVSLGAALSNAKSISVSIDSVSIDSIPVAVWEDAADHSDHTLHAYIDAVDGNSFLMDSAVAVKGVKITYILKSSLSADLKAQFQDKKIAVGSTSNPAEIKIDVAPGDQTVVLEVLEKVYMLGQFLKIDKIKTQEQGFKSEPGPSGQNQTIPKKPIHVSATVPN